jgi:hypothetical protein
MAYGQTNLQKDRFRGAEARSANVVFEAEDDGMLVALTRFWLIGLLFILWY